MDLTSALEQVREYAAGGAEKPEEPSVDSVDRKNAESMAQLEKMMRGVR